MIFTAEATKIVYIAKTGGAVTYVGRGHVSRAISLIEQRGHHISGTFDEVEVLGPYTHDQSKLIEKSLIRKYQPPLNDYHNPDKRVVHISPNLSRGRPEGFTEKTQCIIDDINSGELSQSEIARKYGVSRQRIHNLKNNLKKVHETG